MLSVKTIVHGRTLPCVKKFSAQSLLFQHLKTIHPFSVYENEMQQKRWIYVSVPKRDIEASFKAIAAGFGAMGVIGPGIGTGLVFGELLNAASRNPSLSNQLFQYAIMGAAFCEALGLMAIMIAIVAMMS